MNTQTNDGGSAFPVPPQQFNQFLVGMTLRDYFAAAAMQGMLGLASHDFTHRAFALDAYRYADAMLAERTKTKEAQP